MTPKDTLKTLRKLTSFASTASFVALTSTPSSAGQDTQGPWQLTPVVQLGTQLSWGMSQSFRHRLLVKKQQET